MEYNFKKNIPKSILLLKSKYLYIKGIYSNWYK